MNEDINNGNITKLLLKPVPLVTDYLAGVLAQKIYQCIFMGLILIVIGLCLNIDFQSINFNVLTFIFFLSSLVMAMLIMFLLDFAIGLTFFWVHEIDFLHN